VINALRYHSDLSEKDLEKSIDDLFELDIAMFTPAPDSLREVSKIAKRYEISI